MSSPSLTNTGIIILCLAKNVNINMHKRFIMEEVTQDDKRYLWLLSVVIPTIPLLSIVLYGMTNNGLAWWLAPFVVYGIIPIADWIVGEDNTNVSEAVAKQISKDRYYKHLLYAFILIQYIVFFLTLGFYATTEMSVFGAVGLILTLGGVGGIGINTAHELGHKKNSLDEWMSKIGLAQTGYGHFYVEHNLGHHKMVATREDPATSRYGESFWAFYPRCVYGSVMSAWKIEKARLKRAKQPLWSVHNNILQTSAMSLGLGIICIAAFGPVIIPVLVLQAIYGSSLLEVVNYVEHYGLLRQKDENGKYEKCQPEHSWNSNHLVTNLFLFHLQRHSDHHANPSREYQSLRDFEDVPRLPNGYAGMITVAYIPPLWRRIMDHRVVEHYKGDMSRINVA
jgi:alkane 1-monooxygenase